MNFKTNALTKLLLALLVLSQLSTVSSFAQPVYRAGDIIENFSLINRRTGLPMQLSDFAGKILFLDFFAHWCPVCNAAAPQLESGIYERYRQAGNAAGLPVVYVLCNLQGDFTPRDIAGTDSFIARFGTDAVVLQDNNRALQRRFTSAGGQPTFAVINGVANSVSHRQWELVFSLHGYTSPGRVQPIADFQAAIDSVQAPPAAIPVQITEQPRPQNQTVFQGASVSLSVSTAGSEPIAYQWFRNGEAIPDANAATLMLLNLQVHQSGTYTVRISNPVHTITSEPAHISVEAIMEISSRLSNGRFSAAGTFEFDGTGTPGRTYRVEVSLDLVTWSVLTRITGAPATQTVQDPFSLPSVARFYRTVAE
jgi:thiol-disulfide isomerase/thioredoxin